MPKILYVYQKQERKLTNIHGIKIHFKVWGKKMLKDELTGNPRWGQNVINKVNMKIFVPVLTLKRHSDFCFVIFQVNLSYRATKNCHCKSKVFCMYGTVALRSPIPTLQLWPRNYLPKIINLWPPWVRAKSSSELFWSPVVHCLCSLIGTVSQVSDVANGPLLLNVCD